MTQPRIYATLPQSIALALLIGAPCIASAQTPASAEATVTPGAMFIAQVDREDMADLANAVPAAGDIVKGLFPEDLETPENRHSRERCERLLKAGYGCLPTVRTYTRYSLPGVNFAVGSWVLPDSMKAQLRTFADVLRGRESKAPAIRIDGHADATGSADANLTLSQRRAESVREYLVSLGVAQSLLSVQGFGSRNLRNAQDPAAGENRRVEIARNLEGK